MIKPLQIFSVKALFFGKQVNLILLKRSFGRLSLTTQAIRIRENNSLLLFICFNGSEDERFNPFQDQKTA